MTNPVHKLKIVVSYRRSDAAMAGRIFDRLVQRFGTNSVFLDIDNIPFGVDFRKHIEAEMAACDVVVAVIGPDWIGARPDGDARIMEETDPVRAEIETALGRDIPIIPVLLDHAAMPQAAQLPASLKEFAYRNALEVESGRDFGVHVERLIKAIERTMGAKLPVIGTGPVARADKGRRSPPAKTMAVALGGLALAAGIAALAYFGFQAWNAGRAGRAMALAVDAEQECKDLKSVLPLASNGFAEIRKGQPSIVGSAERFDASVTIEGYESCWIHVPGNKPASYACGSPTVETRKDGEELLKAKAERIESCLGDSAKRGVSTSAGRRWYTLSTGQTIIISLFDQRRGDFLDEDAEIDYYALLQILQRG